MTGLIPEEIHGLLFSRSIIHRDIHYYQTLAGHTADLLCVLRDCIGVHEVPLRAYCRRQGTDFTGLCRILFMLTGLLNLYKLNDCVQAEIKEGGTPAAPPLQERCRPALALLNDAFYQPADETCGITEESARTNLPDSNGISFGVPLRNYWRIIHALHKKAGFSHLFAIPETVPRGAAALFRETCGTTRETAWECHAPHQGRESPALSAVVMHCIETCRAAADRALLRKIFDGEDAASCIILGGALSGEGRRNAVFTRLRKRRGGVETLLREEPPRPPVAGFFSSRYGKKIDWVTRRLTGQPAPSRILAVFPSEETLLSAGRRIAGAIAADRLYIYAQGLFPAGARRWSSLDSRALIPDFSSERMDYLPPDTAALSLYGYQDFFHCVHQADSGTHRLWGRLLCSTLVLFDVPFTNGAVRRHYTRVLRFVRENGIPAVITGGDHEDVLRNTLARLFGSSAVQTDDLSGGAVPRIAAGQYRYCDGSSTLSPAFIDAVEDNFRKGVHQLVVCPNPVYAQRVYHALQCSFSGRRLPVAHLELYHGLFGIADKMRKLTRAAAKMLHGAAVFVATPHLFPDVYGKFPVIFMENIPVIEGIDAIVSLTDGFEGTPAFPEPVVHWSNFTAPVPEGEMNLKLPEELTVQARRRMRRRLRSAGCDAMDAIRIRSGAVNALPFSGAFDRREIDLQRLYRVPVKSDVLLRRVLKYRDPLVKPLPHTIGGLYRSVMPYHPDTGVTGSPDWIDEYIP